MNFMSLLGGDPLSLARKFIDNVPEKAMKETAISGFELAKKYIEERIYSEINLNEGETASVVLNFDNKNEIIITPLAFKDGKVSQTGSSINLDEHLRNTSPEDYKEWVNLKFDQVSKAKKQAELEEKIEKLQSEIPNMIGRKKAMKQQQLNELIEKRKSNKL